MSHNAGEMATLEAASLADQITVESVKALFSLAIVVLS